MQFPSSIRQPAVIVVVFQLSVTLTAGDHVRVDRSDGAMVVSEYAAASRVGRAIMMKGGNAVDAAVATAFALAVTWPEAGNIGGGGFMMIRPADGRNPVCVDYREVAPLTMHSTSFHRNDTTFSQKAVGVPGTVRGLSEAHRRFGRLPWKELVLPAVRLAREGFYVNAALANSVNRVLNIESVRSDSKYAELRRVYGKSDGRDWEDGDRMVLPDLAVTLAAIADDANAFYSGQLAELLVAEMERGDGAITHKDLSDYQPKVRPAMKGTFRGYTIIGAPPPSSGGTCVIEALNILEHFDLASRKRFDARNVHLIAEASRRAFADRARYLGDPAFTEIPAFLTSKAYAEKLAAGINLQTATPSEKIAPEIPLAQESQDTTHFSIIDSDGMAVSNTYTLEASWGSRIVVRGAGYVLNNEMGDFNWFPGETNRAGRIGTKANQIAPGKRMLSSQTPSFVEKDGQLILITGSPGGRTIINTVLCIILNVTEFGMDVATAVDAARQHHQWFPDVLHLENADQEPLSGTVERLQQMGHATYGRSLQGSAHSIGINPETGIRTGVSDRRRSGRPAGISAGTLTIFDFSELSGTRLSETASTGPMTSRWTSDIGGSVTDGKDHFLIQRDAPDDPFESYLPLKSRSVSNGTISVTATIASAQFAGDKQNEQLRIGFTQDTDKPRVTARMIIGRGENNSIIVRGEALGGGDEIAPSVLCSDGRLGQAIVLRLTLDTTADTYEIESRTADSSRFRSHGTGKVASTRTAKFLRLSVLNDFSARGEHVALDRIVLQAP